MMTGPNDRRTVLLVSDNGQGLGHVTRLMGIARRLPEHLVPVMLTLSEAHPTVRDQGFCVEYFPSRLRLHLTKTHWSPVFALRLLDAAERLRPAVVVVDHVAPAAAFAVLRDRHPDIHLVWSRRGLWRRGANEGWEVIRGWFDHVVEPGDIAAAFDEGPTPHDRAGVTVVPPVTLLAGDELLPRAEARAELGLPADEPCVLVALSADDPEQLAALVHRVREVTDAVAPDVHLFAPRHTLHGDRLAEVPRVTMRPVYPIARYLRAFDLAVTAAGYNTLHEVVRAGVPGVFVPKAVESVDDQTARARGAAARGAGWMATGVHDEAFSAAVREGLTGGRRALDDEDVRTNGAVAAADLIAALAASVPARRAPTGVPGPEPATLEPGWTRFLSGWGRADRKAPRRVLDVIDLSDRELRVLAKDLVVRQREGEAFKSVLLVSATSDVDALRRRSLAYETCLTPEQIRLATGGDPSRYRERRLQGVAEAFGASEVRRLSRAADLAGGDDGSPRRRPRFLRRLWGRFR